MPLKPTLAASAQRSRQSNRLHSRPTCTSTGPETVQYSASSSTRPPIGVTPPVTLSEGYPLVKTVFQRAERVFYHPRCDGGTRRNGDVAVARPRARHPSVVQFERPLIGVSELARDIGLTRSTAHRYIATLAQLGYLQRDPDSKRYRLGPKVLDLGFSAINSMDLREISAPYLRRLSDETGHTVNLAILDDTDVVYIERCRTARPGQREIDLNLHVGARLPAYCTAMGKAILAFRSDDAAPERL